MHNGDQQHLRASTRHVEVLASEETAVAAEVLEDYDLGLEPLEGTRRGDKDASAAAPVLR